MKNFKWLMLLVALLALGVQAQAAVVQGSASLSLISTTTDGTATFNFDGYDFFDAFSVVNDFSPFFADSSHSDVVGASLANTYNLGSASGEATAEVGISVNAASGFASGAGNASAGAFNELGFTVDGSGSVTLTFEYTLDVSIAGAEGTEYAFAGISVDDSLGGFESYTLELDGFLDGDGNYTDNFTFDLVLLVDGYDSGFLTLESSFVADTGVTPVPVPAAAWLFFSAITGLAGLSRRKLNK